MSQAVIRQSILAAVAAGLSLGASLALLAVAAGADSGAADRHLVAGWAGAEGGGEEGQATAALGVDVTGPAAAAPGSRAAYSITVSNRSNFTATNVLVTATLPVSIGIEAFAGGGVEVGPGVVAWTLGELAGPITRTLSVAGRLATTLALGEDVIVRADVSSSSPDATADDDRASWRTVSAAHDLRPSIAPSASTARPSERVTYTVALDNVSLVAADDIVLSVTLGAGLEWLDDTAISAGFVRDASEDLAPVIRFVRARQDGPSSVDFLLAARVGAELAAGATVTAAVAASAVSANVPADIAPAASAPVSIVLPDVQLLVIGGESTALGGMTRLTTFWSNGIGAPARRAILTATLPSGVRHVSSTPLAELVDGTPIGPARVRWLLGPAPEASGELAGPEIVLGHDVAFGDGAMFTTAIEVLDGARDARPADNRVERVTRLYAPDATSLELEVPATMTVDSEASVRVLALDGRGQGVADGTLARFTATAGGLAEPDRTTSAGVATTAYRAPRMAGVVEIGVEVDGIAATSPIHVLPDPPADVTATAAASSAVAGTTVGIDVEVVDRFGNPVADGTAVRAAATDGVVSPPVAETLAGKARFGWRASTAGLQTITVRSGTIDPGSSLDWRAGTGGSALRSAAAEVSTSASVLWLAGPPAALTLMAEPPAIGAVGGLVTVGAAVVDAEGNRVEDGVPVRFAAAGGSFARPIETTRNGLATAAWTSGEEIGSIELTATVEREGAPPIAGSTTVEVAPADLGLSAALFGPRGRLDDEHQIHPGERLSLTLGVRNAGLATARNVLVSARLPTPLHDVSAETADGVPLTAPADPPPALGADTWSIPDLVAGQALTVTISGRFERSHAWSGADLFFVRGAVTSTTPEASVVDLVRTAQVRVTAADLFAEIGIDATASSLAPGGRIVYDVAVGNRQLQTIVPGGLISVTLPAGTRLTDWSTPSGGALGLEEATGFETGTGTLAWRVIGPVPASGALRVWTHIAGDVRGDTDLIGRVEIGSDVLDVDAVNDTDAVTVRLPGGVNLVVGIEGAASAPPGEIVEHAVIVRNLARTDPASGVVVNSYLPAGVEIVEVSDPGRIVAPGRAQWEFERLGPGGRPEISIRWRVPAASRAGGTLEHRVEALSDAADTNPADNTASHTTVIEPGPPSAITLSAEAPELVACPTGSTVVTARVTDAAGNPVVDGAEVIWTTSLGALVPSRSTTVDGVATSTLVADGLAGRAAIRASSLSASGTVGVLMQPGPPADIALALDPEVGIVGRTMDVRVALADACGSPAEDGTAVRVAVSRGDLGGGATERVVPTAGGFASAALTVAAGVGPLRILASAVDAPGVQAERFVRVEAAPTPEPPARLWLPRVERRGR